MTFSTRRTLLAAAIGLAAVIGAAAALAGPRGHGGDRAACADDRLAHIAERYDLSQEQQAQVKTILEEERTAALRLHQETRKRIEGVLTEAQRTALAARLQQRLDRHLDRLTRRLDLTPEQATQVRAILAERRDNPDLDRTGIETRISAVLNPEQRARFESMTARGDRAPKCGGRGGRPMGPPSGGPMNGPMDGGPMAGPAGDPPDDDGDAGPEGAEDGSGPEPR